MKQTKHPLDSWTRYEWILVQRSCKAVRTKFQNSLRGWLNQLFFIVPLGVATLLFGVAFDASAEILSASILVVALALFLPLQFLYEYTLAPWRLHQETLKDVPPPTQDPEWLSLTDAAKRIYNNAGIEAQDQLDLKSNTDYNLGGEGPIAAARATILEAASAKKCTIRGCRNKGLEPKEIPFMVVDDLFLADHRDLLFHGSQNQEYYYDVEVNVHELAAIDDDYLTS